MAGESAVSTVRGLRGLGSRQRAPRRVFNTHYRKELNLSEEALGVPAGRATWGYAAGCLRARWRAAGPEQPPRQTKHVAGDAALFDDLNGPEALAALFDLIQGNAELDRGRRGRSGGRGGVARNETPTSSRSRRQPRGGVWIERLPPSGGRSAGISGADRIRDGIRGAG